MRLFTLFITVLSLMSVIYKYRYRLVNALLAIRFLRKATIVVTMNMPIVRRKLLPSLFRKSNS